MLFHFGTLQARAGTGASLVLRKIYRRLAFASERIDKVITS
jgi:hypothetical protein